MSFEAFRDWLLGMGVPAQLLGLNAWIYQVFLVVFLTLSISYGARKMLDRLYKLTELTSNPWDDVFIDSARKPLRMLIWLVGLLWAAEITQEASEAAIFQFIDPVRSVGVIALIVWFLVRFIRELEVAIQSPERLREPMDKTTASAIGKLLRASVIITGVLVALQTLGFSISGVLAFGGIGGIAVGFAAKDLLANFFGGLMIYMDRPFVVGDWVRSPDKNIEGTVEDIGWRLTRIRTFDKRPLYVPNATFATISLENPSRMSHRRIYETIGIRYCDVDGMQAITEEVKAMLIAHEEIDDTQTMIVNFNQFGPSSLDFFIYTFTKTTNWIHYHEVKQDVLLKISDIIGKHGAEIAFPTRTLHVESTPLQFAGMDIPASADGKTKVGQAGQA